VQPPAVITVVNTSRAIVPVSGGLQMRRQFLLSSRGFELNLLRERPSGRSRIVIIARFSDGRVDLSLAVVGNK
jgi:hypothetical protein